MGTMILWFENQLKVCVPMCTGTKTHTGTCSQANSAMLAGGAYDSDRTAFVLPSTWKRSSPWAHKAQL